LGAVITSEARCTREIISRIGMAKAAFNMEKSFSTRKLELNLRKKIVKCYIWNIGFVWCWNLGHFGKEIRNTWKVLKRGAGEGWRRSVGPIV